MECEQNEDSELVERGEREREGEKGPSREREKEIGRKGGSESGKRGELLKRESKGDTARG